MRRAVSYPRMVRLPRGQICQGCQLTANSPRRMRLPRKITSLQRASWPSKAILLRRQLCHKGWLHQGWDLCQGWPHRAEGQVSRERNVHLPCQLQKGDTKRVTTAAPDRAADPQHDPNNRPTMLHPRGGPSRHPPRRQRHHHQDRVHCGGSTSAELCSEWRLRHGGHSPVTAHLQIRQLY